MERTYNNAGWEYYYYDKDKVIVRIRLWKMRIITIYYGR